MHPPLISADSACTHGKRSGEATEDEDLQGHDPLNVPQDTIVALHRGPPILFKDLPCTRALAAELFKDPGKTLRRIRRPLS